MSLIIMPCVCRRNATHHLIVAASVGTSPSMCVWAQSTDLCVQAVLLGVEELTGDNRYLCGFCTSKQASLLV